MEKILLGVTGVRAKVHGGEAAQAFFARAADATRKCVI